jgi:hypothetical protein
MNELSLLINVGEHDSLTDKIDDNWLVIRIRQSKKARKHNDQYQQGQKDKQRSTKYYTEN